MQPRILRTSAEANLLHELVLCNAQRRAEAAAVVSGAESVSYSALAEGVEAFANGCIALGLSRGERVAVYLDKRVETLVSCFGAAAAGCVFVPINPVLKPAQVGHILRDCGARVLVTSADRLATLREQLADAAGVRHVVAAESAAQPTSGVSIHAWAEMLRAPAHAVHRVIDTDMVSILYTSGSTGKPKGVVLSHRNMVAGAKSVVQYLEHHSGDTLLAALPLSFDAGFSQLTTAFHAGARVVLLNYLLPRDVLNAVVKERVTGLTAVPPLWIQLSQLEWPETVTDHLRYIANTGGRMPLETLRTLRKKLPRTKPYLMYGLTEAFRATYLPPEEVDRRPDSIGKAIPNAEVLVLREDGTPCAPNEPGELVQRGALVAMGYWNDPERTAERFRPLPGRERGLALPEIAVFSGDTVRMDEEGFLYFNGRRDEMIKTSGYRVSPTEVEEILHATGKIGDAAALGVPHAALGQAIVAVVTPRPGSALSDADLLAECRDRLPAYMVPARIEIREDPLPRNANGKIDRKLLAEQLRNGVTECT
jgi:acyl-CoA ligase (AMP-forming) (exosortase A-associated)